MILHVKLTSVNQKQDLKPFTTTEFFIYEFTVELRMNYAELRIS